MNNREAAAYLGLSVRTMNRYRVTGDGPPHYRLGGRVRYVRAELDECVAGSRRSSTSDDDFGYRQGFRTRIDLGIDPQMGEHLRAGHGYPDRVSQL